MLDSFTLDIWRFVRGDTGPREFEQWLYARTDELERRLGAQKALDVLSADYGASAAVADVRRTLRQVAEQASSSLPCRCITLSNVAVVEMGSASLRRLGDRRGHTCFDNAVSLGVHSVSVTIPPIIAVLSDARHDLHIISWAIEVLVTSTSLQWSQEFDDIRPSVL